MLDENNIMHNLSVAHAHEIMELKDNHSRPISSPSDYNQGDE